MKYKQPTLVTPKLYSFQMEADKLEQVREQASINKVPVSELIRACVAYCIEHRFVIAALEEYDAQPSSSSLLDTPDGSPRPAGLIQ